MYKNTDLFFFVPDGGLIDDPSTPKTTSEPDESLILNTDLPIFLVEPQNAFVIKNRPATLHCRAAHALNIYFKCNGAKKVETTDNWFVDPQSGVRIFEAEVNVTRDMVEEYFEKFKCECYAWSGRGNIKSQPATVEVACKLAFIMLMRIWLKIFFLAAKRAVFQKKPPCFILYR